MMSLRCAAGFAAVLAAVASVSFADHAIDAGSAPKAKSLRESAYTGNPTQPQKVSFSDDIKHPVDWFSWGADLRLRHEYLDNGFLLNSDPPGEDLSFGRYRARVWGTLGTPDLQLNTRLAWESRYWLEPASRDEFDPASIFFDNLNAKVRFGAETSVPITATIGRQDIILGDGFLVLEGTPLDGSTSIYFDAARFNFDFKDAKTTVDAIAINQYSDQDEWLPPAQISAFDQGALIEQDEQGIILYGTNKSIERTSLEPYFIYKHSDRVRANGDEGDIYTLGARVQHDFNTHWQAKVEAAQQFGTRNNPVLFPDAGDDVDAQALTSRLTYFFRDKWQHQLFAGYEFLSGDDPGSGANEQFDPLWGRWPQFSELYVYTYNSETRIAEVSNLQRLTAGWQASPTSKLTLMAAYHAMFSHTTPYSNRDGFGDGHFRGNLFTSTAKYMFNRYAAAHIKAEYFIPENYYSDAAGGSFDSRRDPAMYFRVELVLTF